MHMYMHAHSLIELKRLGVDAVPTATAIAGTRARVRIKATRFHPGISTSRQPDMMIWPAYVQTIVDAWPAARSPTAQMYSDKPPMASASAYL